MSAEWVGGCREGERKRNKVGKGVHCTLCTVGSNQPRHSILQGIDHRQCIFHGDNELPMSSNCAHAPSAVATVVEE